MNCGAAEQLTLHCSQRGLISQVRSDGERLAGPDQIPSKARGPGAHILASEMPRLSFREAPHTSCHSNTTKRGVFRQICQFGDDLESVLCSTDSTVDMSKRPKEERCPVADLDRFLCFVHGLGVDFFLDKSKR